MVHERSGFSVLDRVEPEVSLEDGSLDISLLKRQYLSEHDTVD